MGGREGWEGRKMMSDSRCDVVGKNGLDRAARFCTEYRFFRLSIAFCVYP